MSAVDEFACLHAWVEGRVQGVGFRYFVQEEAQGLGITGWVRNVGEDRVEVWAEGKQANLTELLNSLQRGPRSAYVSDVRVEWETPKGVYPSFQIVSSAWF
jgi:acylphosphatase